MANQLLNFSTYIRYGLYIYIYIYIYMSTKQCIWKNSLPLQRFTFIAQILSSASNNHFVFKSRLSFSETLIWWLHPSCFICILTRKYLIFQHIIIILTTTICVRDVARNLTATIHNYNVAIILFLCFCCSNACNTDKRGRMV